MTQTESGTKQEAGANDSKKLPLSLPKLSAWREELDMLSKALFIVVGGAYVVGLLILNAYVRQYGVHYLNFLQIEYVMAGITWAFLTVVNACFLWFIGYRIRGALTNFTATKGAGKIKRTGHFGKAIFYVLSALIAGLVSLFYIMRIVTDEDFSFTNRVVWISVLGSVLTTGVLIALSGRLREQVSFILSSGGMRDEPLRHVRETLFDVGYNVAVLVSGLSLYALMVFPNISSVYGGGKIQTAAFIVKSEQLETLKFLGLSVNENSRIIGPLAVILESPDYFLIKPPEGYADKQVKAIRLKKDAVDAALYVDTRIKQ